jgi:hypothetical protein
VGAHPEDLIVAEAGFFILRRAVTQLGDREGVREAALPALAAALTCHWRLVGVVESALACLNNLVKASPNKVR